MKSAAPAFPELEIIESEPNRLIPSWVISLVLHGVLFLCLIFGFNRQGVPEGSGESFRDVGLFTKGDVPSSSSDAAGSQDAADSDAAEAAASDPLLSEPMADTGPAVPLQLPETTTVGAGVPLPTGLPSAAASRPKKSAGKGLVRGAAGGGAGPRFGRSDGTSFFQIAAQGDHFYYIVDCSGSMDEENAIGVARAETMASIERLDSTKRFQVLFYDSDLHPMLNGKQEIFFATDINRTFARQFINAQQPRSGTMHKPALTTALRSAPNVIFFLTDGDTPELSPRDLKDLRDANRNNTQIHVIEFGKGAKLGSMNWLEQLAKDHNGTYRYRDVTAFRDR
ncbi:MAG: hypothetical protein JWN70_6714 [Planctomycetaceae bacterium]|nr:hypothetical protein [Planctomycetaceae bacterium]